jgi:hypothetical protein
MLYSAPVSKRKKPRALGRFVPCPASFVAHDGWVFVEVQASQEKEAHFFFCTRCRSRCFLNTWQDAWGFTLAQVLNDWHAEVDIPPAHRIELEREEYERGRKAAKERITT